MKLRCHKQFSANGMSPPVVSSGPRPEEPQREDKCLGTILCMLSCKEGYKLGPSQQSGCQSCSCVKKNQRTEEISSSMYNKALHLFHSVGPNTQAKKNVV